MGRCWPLVSGHHRPIHQYKILEGPTVGERAQPLSDPASSTYGESGFRDENQQPGQDEERKHTQPDLELVAEIPRDDHPLDPREDEPDEQDARVLAPPPGCSSPSPGRVACTQ